MRKSLSKRFKLLLTLRLAIPARMSSHQCNFSQVALAKLQFNRSSFAKVTFVKLFGLSYREKVLFLKQCFTVRVLTVLMQCTKNS